MPIQIKSYAQLSVEVIALLIAIYLAIIQLAHIQAIESKKANRRIKRVASQLSKLARQRSQSASKSNVNVSIFGRNLSVNKSREQSRSFEPSVSDYSMNPTNSGTSTPTSGHSEQGRVGIGFNGLVFDCRSWICGVHCMLTSNPLDLFIFFACLFSCLFFITSGIATYTGMNHMKEESDDSEDSSTRYSRICGLTSHASYFIYAYIYLWIFLALIYRSKMSFKRSKYAYSRKLLNTLFIACILVFGVGSTYGCIQMIKVDFKQCETSPSRLAIFLTGVSQILFSLISCALFVTPLLRISRVSKGMETTVIDPPVIRFVVSDGQSSKIPSELKATQSFSNLSRAGSRGSLFGGGGSNLHTPRSSGIRMGHDIQLSEIPDSMATLKPVQSFSRTTGTDGSVDRTETENTTSLAENTDTATTTEVHTGNTAISIPIQATESSGSSLKPNLSGNDTPPVMIDPGTTVSTKTTTDKSNQKASPKQAESWHRPLASTTSVQSLSAGNSHHSLPDFDPSNPSPYKKTVVGSLNPADAANIPETRQRSKSSIRRAKIHQRRVNRFRGLVVKDFLVIFTMILVSFSSLAIFMIIQYAIALRFAILFNLLSLFAFYARWNHVYLALCGRIHRRFV